MMQLSQKRIVLGCEHDVDLRQAVRVVLHELGGLEYAEIAQATNQSVAGVETAIFRARRACRAELSGGGALDHEAASKLVGRFVAGLESPDVGSEFQRADCAPRDTLGDGRMSIIDWAQAGRYAGS